MANTRKSKWEDPLTGLWYLVEVPADAPDTHLEYGIRLGPPGFDGLPWPDSIKLALNHELFVRGIITFDDAVHRRHDLKLAVQSALNIDVDRLLGVYYEETTLSPD